MVPRTSGDVNARSSSVPPVCGTHGHTRPAFSQQTFLLASVKVGRYDAYVTSPLAATSGVDWSQVHAVRLLGVALAFLILLWAIRRMFGGKK
jgi:hypothetical protein